MNDSWIDLHNERLKMFEKKYRILDETGKEIATGMTLGMAVIFIKGYAYELFNDHMRLTIDELEPVVGERPNRENDNQEEPGQLDYSAVYG